MKIPQFLLNNAISEEEKNREWRKEKHLDYMWSSVMISKILSDSNVRGSSLQTKFSRTFNLLFDQKTRPSICFKTCGRIFQALG